MSDTITVKRNTAHINTQKQIWRRTVDGERLTSECNFPYSEPSILTLPREFGEHLIEMSPDTFSEYIEPAVATGVNIKDFSDEDLIAELKERGYVGMRSARGK